MNGRWMLIPLAPLAAPLTAAYGATYLTVEQAQALMFPGERLQRDFVKLTDAQTRAVERDSGVSVLTPEVHAWRASGGGWFFADRVYGKHELIAYALALDSAGAVRQVEILSYREAYGGEVRLPAWLAQFKGRTHADPVELNEDIKNVSGATLSCRHVTQGVRRLLSTWELVLAPRAGADD